MTKRTLPIYQVSSEYADCLEKAFAPSGNTAAKAMSDAAVSHLGRKPGAMGNTPLSSSRLGTISEDTAHVSIWANYGLNEKALFDRLQNCQNESRRRASEYVPEETTEQTENIDVDADTLEFQDGNTTCDAGGGRYIEGHGTGYMEFAGKLWKVLPRGLGGGDGRAFYPYVLCAGGVTIAFRKKCSETVSNAWVEFGSIPLRAALGQFESRLRRRGHQG